jgi:hypothetical protein
MGRAWMSTRWWWAIARVVAFDLSPAWDRRLKDSAATVTEHLYYSSQKQFRNEEIFKYLPLQRNFASKADKVLDDPSPRNGDSYRITTCHIRDRTYAALVDRLPGSDAPGP